MKINNIYKYIFYLYFMVFSREKLDQKLLHNLANFCKL
jgi:hypothetical protein